MKSIFKTKKVSIYTNVKVNGEIFEAQGSCELSWYLEVNNNLNEVFGISIGIPEQKVSSHLYYLDNNGKEQELMNHEVLLENIVVDCKNVKLNSALLPSSIEVRDSTTVGFIGNSDSPF